MAWSLAILAAASIAMITAGVTDIRRRNSIIDLVAESQSQATPLELPTILSWLPRRRQGGILDRILSARAAQQEKLDRKCALAQRPWGLTGAELDRLTVGGLIVWPIAGGLVATLLGVLPIYGLLAGILPALVPYATVDTKATRRRKVMAASLPDLLDLLAMIDQAGAGTELEGLRIAAGEIRGPLGEEIEKALARAVRLGASVEQVFVQLAADTQLVALDEFATSLAVSEQYGGGTYSQAIQAQAERLRTARKQEIEKKIAGLSSKMMVPLGLFILPAILLLAIGPTVPEFLKAFR